MCVQFRASHGLIVRNRSTFKEFKTSKTKKTLQGDGFFFTFFFYLENKNGHFIKHMIHIFFIYFVWAK